MFACHSALHITCASLDRLDVLQSYPTLQNHIGAMFAAVKDVRLEGKTVLVTGGNVGLGRESALDFAKRGARVIVACRNQQRGDEAVELIKKESANDNVVLELLDLASFKSIREFAERINKNEGRLDILMNNAGVMNIPNRTLTEEGHEMQLGVNHLGHFLLTYLLLDLVKRSAPSRIVNLSSSVHAYGKMKWDDLTYEKGGYGGWTAYGQSKLANVLFTKELNKRLAGTDVTTYAVHPGAVATDLQRHTNFIFAFLIRTFSKSAAKGAETQIYCSLCPGLEKESGNYFVDCTLTEPGKLAKVEEDAARLWRVSLELTGLPKEE